MSELTTGLDKLDRDMSGGIPESYMLTVRIPPSSNGERFLHQIMSENSQDRQIFYFTVERSSESIRQSMSNSGVISENNIPQISDIRDSTDKIDKIRSFLRKSPDDSILVLDSVDSLELEQDRERYLGFLNELTEHLTESNSNIILVGSDEILDKPNRVLTEKLSDVIFDINVLEDGEELLTYLSVTKFRGEQEITEQSQLRIGEDTVSIDTSRDIA